MSKSLANFYTLKDLKDMGFEPMAFRLMVLMAKYRAELSFTDEAMKAAETALQYIHNFVTQLPEESTKGEEEWVKGYKEKFLEAINDDLNTPQAGALVLEIIQEAYKRQQLRIYQTLLDFDRVLGINIKKVREAGKEELPDTIKTMIKEREVARKNKEWAKSDSLRKQIESAGYILEDTPEGIRCKKK